MKCFKMLAWIILICAGLNWGLIAIADFDIISYIFGVGSLFAKISYGIMGVAAIYSIFLPDFPEKL